MIASLVPGRPPHRRANHVASTGCTPHAQCLSCAMYAVLKEAESRPEKIQFLVVPGLCTGCGCMPVDVAVGQMVQAFDDFVKGQSSRYGGAKEIIEEQPNWYENTEFKDIPVEKVRLFSVDSI